MRMWSRGLGRMNLGIDFKDIKVMTLSEAIEYMPESAREPLLSNLEDKKVITFCGKMLPPTGWEFVITFSKKDLLTILLKCMNRKLLGLFFKFEKNNISALHHISSSLEEQKQGIG